MWQFPEQVGLMLNITSEKTYDLLICTNVIYNTAKEVIDSLHKHQFVIGLQYKRTSSIVIVNAIPMLGYFDKGLAQ